MSSGARRVVSGSFIGDGSARSIKTVGFRPTVVRLYNVTGNAVAVWLKSMPDDAMQKTVDSGAGTTDLSYVTSGGVTPLSDGFTLGADADLNASAETVHWEAVS